MGKIVEDISNLADNYIGKENEQAYEQSVLDSKPDIEPRDSMPETKTPKFEQKPIDERFMSVYLPSNFKFYDFDSIHVRKFELRDLSKMHQVVTTGSYKLFKEVIQGCVDRNINILTPGDFKWLCYWLRTNSYPKTPITLEWVSRYGNKCVSEVTKETITTLEMDISDEELKKWTDKGFTAPLLKFSDIFDEDKLSDADDFMYTHAQYFKGETWEEKIATMEKYVNENGLEALKDVETWDKLIEHGVEETLKVFDLKFDPEKYKKSLEEKIEKAKILIHNLPDGSDDYVMVSTALDELRYEYNELKEKLDKGEEVRPEAEEIFLEMGPYELLSPILSAVNPR